VTTGTGGFCEYLSPTCTFTGGTSPTQVDLQVCEVPKEGWTRSCPPPSCYDVSFMPQGFDPRLDLDLGNWRPVDVKACKVRDLEGAPGGQTVPVPGWEVKLTEAGAVVDTQVTGPTDTTRGPA
jgi:hypothetical protein